MASECGAEKSGFTPAQLEVLRNQIVVYRQLKSSKEVDARCLAGSKPPPLVRAEGSAPASPVAKDLETVAGPLRGLGPCDGQDPAVERLSLASAPAAAPLTADAAPVTPLGPAGVVPDVVVEPPPSTVDGAPAEASPKQGIAVAAGEADQLPGSPPSAPAKHPLILQAAQRGPLYELAPEPPAAPANKGAAAAVPAPSPLPVQSYPPASVLPLLQFELERLARRGYERLRRLSASAGVDGDEPGNRATAADASGKPVRPGFRWPSDGGVPRGVGLLTQRMLSLLERQRSLRARVEAAQREISLMAPAKYKSMAKSHRAQRIEGARRELAARVELASRRARDAKAARAEALGAHWGALKDGLAARNKGVMTAHSRLARERSKAKVDERALRLEAIKAHDFDAYQELLQAQAVSSGDVKYEAISTFLRETEDYLMKLAGKIAGVKLSAEVSKATADAVVAARARGLSEEEVQAAARAAAQDAAAANVAARVERRDALGAGEGGAAADARSQYYALAHSNREAIAEQPSLLRPPGEARLREYQMVGLQWMVSLYNNHLNGILADEMGLGKTVQVMALIAYLMEHKSNYGPHLIIVPNAVLVNWKSELAQWLPSARCVYYVGAKDERARKYVQEVQSLQFNVLVTTYEFVMRDTSRLAKIDWQYIVIDEAQRMKDRESKLAKDLDRFTAARRLLLSGTPLQNDLLELWSLLNLLLPEVFDDRKMFAEWFGKDGAAGGGGGGDADWLEKERRVVVIHRLHQILEPFMLRRQVEDVETKLPPKAALVARVPMTPYQAAIYDWVKATGTIRLDPMGPRAGKHHRIYHTLTNKCMELRKLCNHPLLTYPPDDWGVGDAIVRQAGKLLVLDRVLLKLVASGHRVLLFSTMTRLLDLLEVYLRWRTLPDTVLSKAREAREAEGKAAADGGGGSDAAPPPPSVVRQDRPDLMGYLRIDGTTALEDREAAIRAFNAPGSTASVFLLSIRAAGRGLNLQSADSVVIYDPDPNPKNEEQAIARSHRIGQRKEVRVVHLESVADPVPGECFTRAPNPLLLDTPRGTVDAAPAAESGATSDRAEAATGAGAPAADGEAGPSGAVLLEAGGCGGAPSPSPRHPVAAPPTHRLYADSIESLVRNQIQRVKIDMANEVIDAGRFDQQTSNDERRQTLEALLQDEARTSAAQNTVPDWHELNVALARGDAEVTMFDELDREITWYDAAGPESLPPWMRWTPEELAAAARRVAADRSRRPPDVVAEMAALTGTVVHHHRERPAGEEGAGGAARAPQAPEVAPRRRVSIRLPLPRSPSTGEVSAIGADDDAATTVAGDTEEEDVELGADILDDDATTTPTGGGEGPCLSPSRTRASLDELRHVESTAHFSPPPKRARTDAP